MRCTKCGTKASTLYKQYTKDVLALESCSKCSNDVDPYIEYTEAIKILDLVLFQPEVYRHYFYNQQRSSKTIFKICVISFVISAFFQLCFAKNFSDFSEPTSPLASSDSQGFLLSRIFKSALSAILFCLVLYQFLRILNPSKKLGVDYEDEECFQTIDLTSILTIACLTKVTTLVFIPIMVWVDKEYQWIYQSLTYLTQLLILQNFIASITYGNILQKK